MELLADRQGGRVFFAEHAEGIVVITADEDLAEVRRHLEGRRLPAGCSSVVDWPQLRSGLLEATRAAARASSGRGFVDFTELAGEGMLGLLEAAGGAVVARRLLEPLAARPESERDQLATAGTVWLRHHGAFDPAARVLGIHRHTLRHRISALERILGLDLDRFADRAELWAALELTEVSPRASEGGS